MIKYIRCPFCSKKINRTLFCSKNHSLHKNRIVQFRDLIFKCSRCLLCFVFRFPYKRNYFFYEIGTSTYIFYKDIKLINESFSPHEEFVFADTMESLYHLNTSKIRKRFYYHFSNFKLKQQYDHLS